MGLGIQHPGIFKIKGFALKECSYHKTPPKTRECPASIMAQYHCAVISSVIFLSALLKPFLERK
jgi:hypothetical protein